MGQHMDLVPFLHATYTLLRWQLLFIWQDFLWADNYSKSKCFTSINLLIPETCL